LYSVLWSGTPSEILKEALDYVDFAPDRVACQDATRIGIVALMVMQESKVAAPTTVHCDHFNFKRVMQN
jgi:aconitate hydratase